MATDNIKVNIKYGTRAKMVGEGTEPSIANGTLYVATKDNSRAELYVDLNNNRYIISDAIPVDNVLNTTSSNAIQNAVVSTELANLEGLIGEAEEEIGKVKESLDEYLLKEGGTITGNLQVGGALSVTGQITAPGGIAGHASSAETAKTLTTTLPIDKGGTGQTTLEGVQNTLGITSLSEDVAKNTEWINDNKDIVSNHASDIAYLQAQIDSNDNDISNLQKDVATNTKNIKTNTDDIAALQEDVNTYINTTAPGLYAKKENFDQEVQNRINGDSALSNRIKEFEADGNYDVPKLITTVNGLNVDINGVANDNTKPGLKKELTSLTTDFNELLESYNKHEGNQTSKQHVTSSDITNWNSKAKENHADTSNKYGVGNETMYGHVKLSDTADALKTRVNGVAATPKAVADAKTAMAEDLNAHISNSTSDLYRPHIAFGESTEVDGSLTIDADTVGGMTGQYILDEAKKLAGGGASSASGTIDYSTGNPNSSAQGVVLRNAANTSVHLLPKTTVANIIDLNDKLAGYVKFATGTTEPTKALGTIWYYGSSAPYQIRIWNGTAWEVMNSWQ